MDRVDTAQDQRSSPRYALETSVTLTAEDGRRIAARLVDLSLGGVRLRCAHPVRQNSRCHLEIDSPGVGEALRAEVRIVRIDQAGIAGRFLPLEPEARARLRAWIARCVRQQG